MNAATVCHCADPACRVNGCTVQRSQRAAWLYADPLEGDPRYECPQLPELRVLPPITFTPAPPLSEADLRRIVREEVERALRRAD